MMAEDPLSVYLHKPSKSQMLEVIRSRQKLIDGTVHNLLGDKATPIAKRRAYILAAQALEKYDPSLGVPFDRYLKSQLQPIRRIGRQLHEPITIPERYRRYKAAIEQAREELYDELDREPSQQELADRTGLSQRQMERLQSVDRNVMPVGGYLRATATDESPEGLLPAVDEYDEAREWEDYVYHDLDDVDKQIYDARRKGLMSNIDLAKSLNLTPAAVSQRASKIESRIAKGPYS